MDRLFYSSRISCNNSNTFTAHVTIAPCSMLAGPNDPKLKIPVRISGWRNLLLVPCDKTAYPVAIRHHMLMQLAV